MQLPQCFKIKKIKRYATPAIVEVALLRFQLRFAHLCYFVIITKFTHLASAAAIFCLCMQKSGAMCKNSGIFNSNSLPTYRTHTITKKAYRTSVPYFLTKIEAYRTVPTYRTVPYCHPCIPKLDFGFCCSVNKYHFIELAAFHTYEITYHELQNLKNKQVT